MRRQGTLVAISVVVVALLASGCQVPKARLNAYREVFAKARAAGEEVLVDYRAAKEEYQERQKAQEADRKPKPGLAAFDPAKVRDTPADEVLVRMQAWEVLARYNDALTSLAQGRDPAELHGAFDGLLQSIAALSADVATDIALFGGVIKTVLTAVQRAIEVEEFRRAVREAQPLIAKLASYLIEDTGDYYRVRWSLCNQDRSSFTDRAADLCGSAQRILDKHTHASEDGTLKKLKAVDVAKRINTSLGRLPDWKQEHLLVVAEPGSMEYTASVHTQLEILAGEIEDVVEKAVQHDVTLQAYIEVLSEYVRLVRRIERTHTAMALAVENPHVTLPPPARIAAFAVELRVALTKYRARR